MNDRSTDETVAALYEAAVDDSRWPAALTQVASLADAASAIWFLHDAATNRLVDVRSVGGFTPQSLKLYAEHFQPLDLARKVLERMPGGTMRPMHLYVPDDAIARSEYYQDFYIPTGHRYSCGGTQLIDGQRAILAVHRPPGHARYEPHTVERLQRLLDQLPGVCRVRTLARKASGLAALSTSALAALARPVFVLDGGLAVQYLNPAAEVLMRRDAGLRTDFGRLCTGDAALTHALTRRVAAACRQPPKVEPAPLYRVDAAGRANLELQVAPLPDDLLDPGLRAQPLALLTLRPLFSLARWDRAGPRPCGLSDAEFRLVVALVEGLTPEEYSLRQRITINTVRIHIRNVLRKTSTRRTAEVVALFAPLELLNPC